MSNILKKALSISLVVAPMVMANADTSFNEDRVKNRIEILAEKIGRKVYRSDASLRELREVKRTLRRALDTLRFAQGGHNPPARSCATMYEHDNFSGRALTLNPGDQISNFADLYAWNDTVSAVKVTPGCQVTAYQHSRYRGWSQTFRYNAPNVGGYNDEFSSAICSCN